jgi:adenylate cyclase
MAALLGHLLSLPAGGKLGERLESDDPAQIRWRTFLAVRDFFTALCKEQPIVLVFEDLHWADSLSIDLISLLMEELPRASLLLLCVYRPEREHRCWHLATIAGQKCRGRYTELTLRELTDRQSRQMVESLLPIEAIPLAVRDMILSQSQGNPFFIEEVVRSLIDAGMVYPGEDARSPRVEILPPAIPESVQSVILSRIDRLEDHLQHVLEVASVIGRVFHLRVLAHTLGQEAELEQALWELEERALIYQERTLPEVEYSFKHVLAQETIYHSILRDRRQGFHRQVAAAIEALYQDNLDEYWEQLAHHHEQGGTIERAISYLLKAGEKAKRSNANEEAIAHLSRGLELLTLTPQTPERAQRELDLQIALGVPLVHTKGHAAPEVKAAYARAQELCEQVGDTARRFQVLLGLRRACLCRGELQTAATLEEQLLSTAQSLHDPTYVPWVYVARGETSYWIGEFVQAREHCQTARGHCDPRQRSSDALVYGNDTGIACRVMGAVALWHLGYPDHALEMGEEALDQAQALAHPFSLVFALYFKGLLHQLRREAPLARQHADAVLRISRERGFALYLAWGTILRGWALTQGHPQCGPGAVVEGQVRDGVHQIRSGIDQMHAGIDQMHAGIAAWQATGASVSLPSSLASLAQAYGQVGKIGEAVNLLDEALRVADENGERCWEAELHRLQGELLLLRREKEAQVEACFQRALDVARRQRARSWELRAAGSLGRLLHRQGRIKEARALVQGIYGWFSEGFDTADLRETKALLEQWAG